MRLLDGLKGIDFSGIGDDTFGPWSPDSSVNTPPPVNATQSSTPDPLTDIRSFESAYNAAGGVARGNNPINWATGNAQTSPQTNVTWNLSVDGGSGQASNQSPVDTSFFGPQNLAVKNVENVLTNAFDSIFPPDTSEQSPLSARQNPSGYDSKTGKFNYAGRETYTQSPSAISQATSALKSAVSSTVNAGAGVADSIASAFGFSKPPSSAVTVPRQAATSAPVQSQARQSSGGGSNSGSNSSGSFAQNFTTVTNGILSVVGAIVGAKQQAQTSRQNPAAGAQGARGAAGKRGGSTASTDSTSTYLMIGGGVLAVGVLVYLVAKD